MRYIADFNVDKHGQIGYDWAMLDLAPDHKLGLPVPNPILLAGGMIGFGEACHPGLATDVLGGMVVGPLTLNSRGGSEGLRLAELSGGLILETGQQNRGFQAVLKQFAALWPRLGCPVIVQLADGQPSALAKMAERLADLPGVQGLEILLPRLADTNLTRNLVRAVERISDLPIWVKVPLDRAVELAPLALSAGAVGIVVGQPPLFQKPEPHQTALANVAQPQLVALEPSAPPGMSTGQLYGEFTFLPMLAVLKTVSQLKLPCALIACGGIHTAAHVRQALAAGAQAVQIDSALWIEPGLPGRLVGEWAQGE